VTLNKNGPQKVSLDLSKASNFAKKVASLPVNPMSTGLSSRKTKNVATTSPANNQSFPTKINFTVEEPSAAEQVTKEGSKQKTSKEEDRIEHVAAGPKKVIVN